MYDKTHAQTPGKLQIVESLDREFARLHVNSSLIVESTPPGILYAVPPPGEITASGVRPGLPASIGESVLRSAAVIEQTFGGITASLWDDPFEWTLREYLSTPASIGDHLAEVEATRKRAFSSFTEDGCLLKHVAVPAGGTRPLIDLLLEALLRSTDYQARAVVALKILSGISPPGFII